MADREGGRLDSNVLDGWAAGAAEMKSSKSSSSLGALPFLVGDVMVCLPLDGAAFGGVIGGSSSSPKENRSISGAFFTSGFRLAELVVEVSAFRRARVLTAPSSPSSYSSNRSLLPELPVAAPETPESWNPELALPPKPPPSP